ncbi:hypothetical protein YC2023_018582 [Brassica napus]
MRIKPLCGLGHIGVITSLITSGFPCDLRLPASRFRVPAPGSGSLPPGLGHCLQPPASRPTWTRGNLLKYERKRKYFNTYDLP